MAAGTSPGCRSATASTGSSAVCFGNSQVDPVRRVPAIQDVAQECPWVRAAVVDVRMLRIEGSNDLVPALRPMPRGPDRAAPVLSVAPHLQLNGRPLD
ncbi:hypothetical protein A5481_03170 [Methylobacterium platani]|uniref:Uncharacterized protein n=1 Tax=Methylobacterium platani TaxID=427683 RepID=A0A179SJ03_9HYPH|nr:hypothetical protein A5481_03170 [Methylobacterium platani]